MTKVGAATGAPDDSADRAARRRRFLEREVWALVPDVEVGRRLTPDEEDAILGFGSGGA